MESKKAALVFFILIIILSFAQIVFYYPQLPEMVPSHFNVYGEADSWSSKTSFVIIHVCVIFFLTFVFWLAVWAPGKLPNSFFNFPNKDYWLAPVRREKTLSISSSYMVWFANSTFIFLFIMFQDAYTTGISGSSKLGSYFWFYFCGYLVLTMYIVVKLYKKFRTLPESRND